MGKTSGAAPTRPSARQRWALAVTTGLVVLGMNLVAIGIGRWPARFEVLLLVGVWLPIIAVAVVVGRYTLPYHPRTVRAARALAGASIFTGLVLIALR